MIQLTDEDRCRMACVHLQTIADRHSGGRMLKQYTKDNNIDFKKGDGYEVH